MRAAHFPKAGPTRSVVSQATAGSVLGVSGTPGESQPSSGHPILVWPSCPCVTRVTWLGLEGTVCRQGPYGRPTGKGIGSQAPGAWPSVLVSSGGRARCVPMGPGLRVAPPPSFFAMLGARCILGKGPTPFSRSRPGGAAWVLHHRVTDHPPKSARQQTGSMGRSCWDRCLEATLGKSSRLGSQEDPQSLPHSGAAWTRQGAFSIWATGWALPVGVTSGGGHSLGVHQNLPVWSVSSCRPFHQPVSRELRRTHTPDTGYREVGGFCLPRGLQTLGAERGKG